MAMLGLLDILAYCAGFVLGVMFFIAPLVIWIHVSRMRKEMKDAMATLTQVATAIRREQDKTNSLLVESQQRYIKTMQYVCDCLADLCDNTGGSNLNPAS